MMIEELYDALIEAGASENKARAASRALADYDKRFTGVEKELMDIRGTLKLHGWMLATHTAMLVALLFKAFSR